MINAVPGKATTALSLRNRLQLHDKPRTSVSEAVKLSASTTKKNKEKGRETAERADDFVFSFSSTCQFQEGREAVTEADRIGLSTSSSVSAQLASFSAKLSRWWKLGAVRLYQFQPSRSYCSLTDYD